MARRNIEKEVRVIIKKIEDFEWKHKNLIILLVSVFVAQFILRSGFVKDFIANAGGFIYLDSFIVGVFFPYGFTVIPATAALVLLSKMYNPFIIAPIAALGGMISDYLIFRFVGNRIILGFEEVAADISRKFKNDIEKFRKKITRSKVLHYLIPIFSGFIIASPLPDELVAILFGSVKFRTKSFLIFSFAFHFIGILALLMIGKII